MEEDCLNPVLLTLIFSTTMYNLIGSYLEWQLSKVRIRLFRSKMFDWGKPAQFYPIKMCLSLHISVQIEHCQFRFLTLFVQNTVVVSLGDVIELDRQINFNCDRIDFNPLFQSKFEAGF